MITLLEQRLALLVSKSARHGARTFCSTVAASKENSEGAEPRRPSIPVSEGVASPESFGAQGLNDSEFDLSDIFPSSSSSGSPSSSQHQLRQGWTRQGLDALAGQKPNFRNSQGGDGDGQQINLVDSPRNLRGVHARHKREGGHTPAEAAAFNEILQSIFADLERTNGPLRPGSSPTLDPYGAQYAMGGNIFRSRVAARRSSPFDTADLEMDNDLATEVDRLKEEMSALGSDAEVLEWAKERIFQPKQVVDGEPVYSAAYPHILTHAIRTVRTHFNNPHLALALFQHAQSLSLESYLSGCLTGAYNEVLSIRWESFRDLEGVELAMREMDANGVGWDRETRAVIGKVCEAVSRGLTIRSGAWDAHAEERLRSLEKRVEVDMEREELIHESKRRSSRARAAHAQSASPSQPHTQTQTHSRPQNNSPRQGGRRRFGLSA